MVDFAIGYLLAGILVSLWFLIDCIRAARKVGKGTANPTDKLVNDMKPLLVAGFATGLIVLWPAGLYMLIKAVKATRRPKPDPQDQVPPEYR